MGIEATAEEVSDYLQNDVLPDRLSVFALVTACVCRRNKVS